MLPAHVSRETEERLRRYEALLLKWQNAVNLVSPTTLDKAWERHILDSAQIEPLLPEAAKIIFDFGSGAGFPSMVLAVMRPDLNVHLVESDQKKCSFLSAVSRETGASVTIHNVRIEALMTDIVPDVITARALAALDLLLEYSLPYVLKNPGLTLIFPKGAKAAEELAAASKKYDFTCEEFPSQTDPEARILRLSGLCIKK